MSVERRDLSVEAHDAVLALVDAYLAKPGNAAGGNLHIVLDDHNFGDNSIKFCFGQAVANDDIDGIFLAHVLLGLSLDDRCRIVFRDDFDYAPAEYRRLLAFGPDAPVGYGGDTSGVDLPGPPRGWLSPRRYPQGADVVDLTPFLRRPQGGGQ